MKFALPTAIIALISMAISSTASGAAADPAKLVDLTYVFDADTVYWPTEPSLVHAFEHYGMTPGGYFYSSAKFAAPEHGGTHMDAPIHFNKQGMTVDEVPLSAMVGPAVVIDFSSRTTQDADAMLAPTISRNGRTRMAQFQRVLL